jgi:hypothetical protein
VPGVTPRLAKVALLKVAPLDSGAPGAVLIHVARTIWIADAHRDNGKRFVVRADEKPTAFLELESATRVRSGPT